MKEKLQDARHPEVKQRKKTVESLQESISKVESTLTLLRSEPRTDANHRAIFSGEKVLEGLQKLLKKAKARD